MQPCSHHYIHGASLVSGPLSSSLCILFSWFQFRLTPLPTPNPPNTCTQTHTHPSLLCWASRGEGSFFSTCTAQCLYVYFLKLLAHLDLSYPSFFHLCSLVVVFSPRLAVMSPVSLQVFSYEYQMKLNNMRPVSVYVSTERAVLLLLIGRRHYILIMIICKTCQHSLS